MTPEDRQRADQESVLFPSLEPFNSDFLCVSQGHTLYWEECGRPDGLPVVVLHGGPGTGATALHRRLFDPSFYRIVVLDQRGAGRSRPLGGLAGNTTDQLVEDLEILREHLGISRWLLFGASWGTTLALAYGTRHPERCLGFVLHATFLPRQAWYDWMFQGLRQIFPEAWTAFAEHIPRPEREDLLKAYYDRLVDSDPEVHRPALEAWTQYELATMSITGMKTDKLTGKTMEQVLAMARIEAYYCRMQFFLDVKGLLRSLQQISHLPVFLTYGRCDVLCTVDHAYDLTQHLMKARLTIVEGAGQTYREPKNAAAVIRMTEAFRMLSL